MRDLEERLWEEEDWSVDREEDLAPRGGGVCVLCVGRVGRVGGVRGSRNTSCASSGKMESGVIILLIVDSGDVVILGIGTSKPVVAAKRICMDNGTPLRTQGRTVKCDFGNARETNYLSALIHERR
jgi:hypothetical protein